MRDNQKVLGPCTFGLTKSRNCAIISQYNLPLLSALSLKLLQFAYAFWSPKYSSTALLPKFLPRRLVFRFGNRLKSEGSKSGEYEGEEGS